MSKKKNKRKASLLEGVVPVEVQVPTAAGAERKGELFDSESSCLMSVGVLHLLYVFQKSSMLARLEALEMRSL